VWGKSWGKFLLNYLIIAHVTLTSSARTVGLHRLSSASVRAIATPGWHGDGGGLYLEVDPSGSKRWAMRLTVNGKRRDFGLGSIAKVSLQQARIAAAEYRAMAHQGNDPVIAKRNDKMRKAQPTFEEAARAIHTQRRQASNGKHVNQWINTLRDYAFPHIGAMRVGEIDTPDVLKVLTRFGQRSLRPLAVFGSGWQQSSTGHGRQAIEAATIPSS
jgi:Arm DNA-binding domain